MLVFTERGKPEGREDQTEEKDQGLSFGHISLEKVIGSVGRDEDATTVHQSLSSSKGFKTELSLTAFLGLNLKE